MTGIALGVAALIIVLSVMNGFQKEVRDRMIAVLSHVEILSATLNRIMNVNNREATKSIEWTNEQMSHIFET